MKKNANPVKPVVIKKVPKRTPIYVGDAQADECLTIEDENDNSVFSCSISQLEHCCGVYELGSIVCSASVAERNSKDFQQELDSTLLKLLNDNTGDGAVAPCITFLANLINSVTCDVLRDSFLRSGMFTCVKTFRNRNSRSTISMWVSNN